MDLAFFHEFLTLADTRNYLQAAARLSISQSTLSRHISAMEQELGVPLFKRTTRRVALTQAGAAFLPHAEKIAAEQDAYLAALGSFTQKKGTPVRVAAVPLMPYYGISELLAAYRQEFPGLPVHIREDRISALYEGLRLRRFDYAFVLEGSKPNPEFARMPFLPDTLSVILPAKHPLAKKPHLRLEQLQGETFLSLSNYTLLYKTAVDALAGAGMHPKITCCGSRMALLVERVAAGEGIAVAAKRAAQYGQVEGVAIVDIYPPIHADLNVVFCRGGHFTGAAKHFLAYTAQRARDAQE
jgi:DNA-binding transcriptional LysR family regulator